MFAFRVTKISDIKTTPEERTYYGDQAIHKKALRKGKTKKLSSRQHEKGNVGREREKERPGAVGGRSQGGVSRCCNSGGLLMKTHAGMRHAKLEKREALTLDILPLGCGFIYQPHCKSKLCFPPLLRIKLLSLSISVFINIQSTSWDLSSSAGWHWNK